MIVRSRGRVRFPQPPFETLSQRWSDQEMNVRYHKLKDDTRTEGVSFYPLLRVFLRHDVNMQYVLGLVDSGSADCVFPASIADLLRIDLRSGQRHEFHGFDNRLVTGFVHRIHLQSRRVSTLGQRRGSILRNRRHGHSWTTRLL